MNKRQAKKKRKKEQQRAEYYAALEELCVVCGKPITDDGLLLCQACREKNKEEQDAAQN